MPRPANSTFKNRGIPGTRATDPDKKLKDYRPEIANSALSVTLGERLAKRYGPVPNIRGDRPVYDESAQPFPYVRTAEALRRAQVCAVTSHKGLKPHIQAKKLRPGGRHDSSTGAHTFADLMAESGKERAAQTPPATKTSRDYSGQQTARPMARERPGEVTAPAAQHSAQAAPQREVNSGARADPPKWSGSYTSGRDRPWWVAREQVNRSLERERAGVYEPPARSRRIRPSRLRERSAQNAQASLTFRYSSS